MRQAAGVRYQLQLIDRPDDLPLLGGHRHLRRRLHREARSRSSTGEPLEVEHGPAAGHRGVSPTSCAGTTIITDGVLPAAGYRIRARYVPNGAWCPWIEVETPDTRIAALDLDAALNNRIDTATSKADAAAADAAAALGKAQRRARPGDDAGRRHHRRPRGRCSPSSAGSTPATSSPPGSWRSRALQTGWNADPTFQLWTLGRARASGRPPGSAGIGAPFAGFYGGGLALDIPAGAIAATVIASSAVPGQMPAADPEARVARALRAGHLHRRQSGRAAPPRRVAAARRQRLDPRRHARGSTAPQGSFTQLGITAQARRRCRASRCW